jgi:hypothetical protein
MGQNVPLCGVYFVPDVGEPKRIWLAFFGCDFGVVLRAFCVPLVGVPGERAGGAAAVATM